MNQNNVHNPFIIKAVFCLLTTAVFFSACLPVFAEQTKPEKKESGLNELLTENENLVEITNQSLKAVVSAGFNNHFCENLPVPVSLTVTNSSDSVFSGTVECEFYTTLDNKPESLYILSGPVTVSGGTEKINRFYVQNCRLSFDIMVVRIRDENGRTVYQSRDPWNGVALDPYRMNILGVLARNGRSFILGPRLQSQLRQTPETVFKSGALPIETVWCAESEIVDEYAPLCIFDIVILGTPFNHVNISSSQISSLVHYIMRGGQVMIPASDEQLLSSLRTAFPAAARNEKFIQPDYKAAEYLRVGDGKLFICGEDFYSDSEENVGPRTAFLHELELDNLPEYPGELVKFLDNIRSGNPNQTSSFLNLGVIALFYIFFSGPILPLFFRKRSKKAIGIYLGSVVVIFCIGFAVLAPLLLRYDADVKMAVITQLTPHGALRRELYSLTSSGGNSYRFSATDKNSQVRILSGINHKDSYRYNWYYRNDVHTAITGNASLGIVRHTDEFVQTPPWGTVDLMVESRDPKMGIFDVSFRNGRLHIKNNTGNSTMQTELVLCEFVKSGDSSGSNSDYVAKYKFVELGAVQKGAEKNIPFDGNNLHENWRTNVDRIYMSPRMRGNIRVYIVAVPAVNIDASAEGDFEIADDESNRNEIIYQHIDKKLLSGN